MTRRSLFCLALAGIVASTAGSALACDGWGGSSSYSGGYGSHYSSGYRGYSHYGYSYRSAPVSHYGRTSCSPYSSYSSSRSVFQQPQQLQPQANFDSFSQSQSGRFAQPQQDFRRPSGGFGGGQGFQTPGVGFTRPGGGFGNGGSGLGGPSGGNRPGLDNPNRVEGNRLLRP